MSNDTCKTQAECLNGNLPLHLCVVTHERLLVRRSVSPFHTYSAVGIVLNGGALWMNKTASPIFCDSYLASYIELLGIQYFIGG